LEQDVYRLHLTSPLHVGERGVGMAGTATSVPSDTLFSALCNALLELEGIGWLQDWLDAFLTRPAPFLITSTFPWAGDVLFYPRPMVRIDRGAGAEQDSSEDGKWLKKVTRVSAGGFGRILAGDDLSGEMDEKVNRLAGDLWITAEERGALPSRLDQVWHGPAPVARVALDRTANSSSLYQVGEVRYLDGCGLWFGVRWREPAWKELLEKALSHLGESGIGGERSSGRGQFRWDRWESAHLPEAPTPGGRAVTLALYHPTAEEAEEGALDAAAYRLRPRGGWVGSQAGQGLRGKAVRMLEEGSVIGWTGEAGDLADVTPEGFDAHRVYRYGLAFPVAVGEGGDG